jgi:hypothetical protein
MSVDKCLLDWSFLNTIQPSDGLALISAPLSLGLSRAEQDEAERLAIKERARAMGCPF